MSRHKSAEKRLNILTTAKSLFLTHGFTGVSMDQISQVAGVAKNTLYLHFKNKTTLFETVLKDHWCTSDVPHLNPHDARDPKLVLTEFAHQLLKYLYQEETMALFRTLIAETPRFPELSASLITERSTPIKSQLMLYLENILASKTVDIEMAANHLFGLLKEDAFWHVMVGFKTKYSKNKLQDMIKKSIDVFICYYVVGKETS